MTASGTTKNIINSMFTTMTIAYSHITGTITFTKLI